MSASLIVAVAANGAIGRKGDLPWRLPADLKRFRRLTMGHHLIMGRRTWESVGVVLPGRTMVVVTRDPNYRPGVEGVLVAHSLKEALRLAEGDDEPFVAGGAALYREAFDIVDRMYLTRIAAQFEADTFFPAFNEERWVVAAKEHYEPDEKNVYPYTFLMLERKRELSGKRAPVAPGRVDLQKRC
ncbi:MAG: dihydrofolate reductase [Acidobacteriota bacterium]